MASQQTPNYRLSRWKGTNRILVEEFNDNGDKIGTAIKGSAGATATEVSARESGDSPLRTTLAKCGNCQIFVGTYTGDGAAARTLTFSGKPLYLLVTTAEGHRKNRSLSMIRGTTTTYADITDTNSVTVVSWADTSVTFETPNPAYGVNIGQTAYVYMALLEK